MFLGRCGQLFLIGVVRTSPDIIKAHRHIYIHNKLRMTQQVQSNKEANLSKQVAELQGRVKSLEQLLHQGKDVLTLEEAAKFMGIARSSLYKMTHEQTIPFYKPNGKMIFFEKSDLLAWVRKNRVSSETEISEEAERIIQRLATK